MYLVDMFLLSKCHSWQQASPSEVEGTAEQMPPSSLVQPRKKKFRPNLDKMLRTPSPHKILNLAETEN